MSSGQAMNWDSAQPKVSYGAALADGVSRFTQGAVNVAARAHSLFQHNDSTSIQSVNNMSDQQVIDELHEYLLKDSKWQDLN